MIYKLMPGLKNLIHYNISYLTGDISAAIIVTFLFIPQSMAYAMIAGVPVVLGLFAATFPLIIYALFGSSRYLVVGPISIVSLLAFSGVSQITGTYSVHFLEVMIFLTVMVGVIQIMLGLIKFGSFIEYISTAVMSGFVSAAAIIIAINQVKSVLGIQLPPYQHLLNYIGYIIANLTSTHLYTAIIGMGSIILLIFIKKTLKTFLGPVIVIILSIMMVDLFDLHKKGVQVIGDIPKGLPELTFALPTFDMVILLFPIAFMIGFIAFAESYAVGKTLANKDQMTVNPNQELFGLGLANLTSSFVGAFPVSGAISRTAVNYQSGAKTNASLILTAAFMLVVTLYLTPLFYYLPHATLGAIIILAVMSLIEVERLVHYVKHEPTEAILFLSTMVITLMVDVFLGLIIGISLSVMINLLKRKFPTLNY